MKKSWGALLATSITTAALVVATAAPVVAAPRDDDPASGPHVTLAGIQKAGAVATEKRIDSLTIAIDRVERNDKVSETVRASILAKLAADVDAMQRLADEIAAATSKAEAAADYHAIFSDYRVYAVALPRALYAAGADVLTGTAIPRLEDAYDTLADKVGGEPSDEQQALLDSMAAEIQDATVGSEGLVSAALAVTPADWNADHDVLAEIRRQLRDAAQDARDAVRAGRELAETLR